MVTLYQQEKDILTHQKVLFFQFFDNTDIMNLIYVKYRINSPHLSPHSLNVIISFVFGKSETNIALYILTQTLYTQYKTEEGTPSEKRNMELGNTILTFAFHPSTET